MIQTLVQPLETTEIMLKHRNTHKHTLVVLKQSQWRVFLELRTLGPRLPEFEFHLLPLLAVQP